MFFKELTPLQLTQKLQTYVETANWLLSTQQREVGSKISQLNPYKLII